MTYQERTDLERWLVGKITVITKDHPLREVEAEWLAEMIMETQGCGFVVGKTKKKAMTEFRAVIGFLESSSRLSPKEHKDLILLAAQPLPDPDENDEEDEP